MATVLTPAELKRALADASVTNIALGPGTFPPFAIRRQDMTITGAGADATVIDGRDAASAEFGIRAHDASHGLHLGDFSITRCGHGARITGSERVTLARLKTHHNGGEGLQGGNLASLLAQDIESWENGWKGQEGTLGIPRFAAHGVYFQGSGTLRRVKCWGNGGCGIQLRGGPWLVEDSEAKGNLIGAGVGAPDVQVMAEGVHLLRCLMTSLTIHKDGGDVGRAVTLEDSTVYGVKRFALNVTAGCEAPSLVRSIMLGRRTGAQPQQDTASEVFDRDPGGLVDEGLRSLVEGIGYRLATAPDTPPPPADEADLAALRAQLQQLREERDGLLTSRTAARDLVTQAMALNREEGERLGRALRLLA